MGKWQLGTIQVDYNLPERFELEYVGRNNDKLRPVMIHRAPFGSMERFLCVVEHCGGTFLCGLQPINLWFTDIRNSMSMPKKFQKS